MKLYYPTSFILRALFLSGVFLWLFTPHAVPPPILPPFSVTVGGGGGRGSGCGIGGMGVRGSGLGFISGLEINSWIGGLGFISGLEINSWIGGGWENISGWKYYFGGTKLHKCFGHIVFSCFRYHEIRNCIFAIWGIWVFGVPFFTWDRGDFPGVPMGSGGGVENRGFRGSGGFPRGGAKKVEKCRFLGYLGSHLTKKLPKNTMFRGENTPPKWSFFGVFSPPKKGLFLPPFLPPVFYMEKYHF